MANFTVNTNTLDGEGGMSLAEAIAAAELTPEDDIITFDQSYLPDFGGSAGSIDFAGTLIFSGTGGAIEINGDINNDGISDVILEGGNAHQFEIYAGAQVTITNVDFRGAQSHLSLGPRDDPKADNGTPGQHGTSGADGEYGGDPNGGDGASNGTDGGDGVDGNKGENVSGAIINYGDLTLVRVGFGSNQAVAAAGQDGGRGGGGGGGGHGGDGNTDMSLDGSAEQGGAGGHGGDGADGGNGGRGGDGGDAAGGLLNMEGGSVTLIDVVFGGRLTSGRMEKGVRAEGGNAGEGGTGGTGGYGGRGGDGGDFGSSLIESLREYEMPGFVPEPGEGIPTVWLDVYGSSNPGIGGNGGDGGDGGVTGRNGNGGDAAPIVNFGTINGNSAMTPGADLPNGRGMKNYSEGGISDHYKLNHAGSKGTAGDAGEGGYEAPTWGGPDGNSNTGWRMSNYWDDRVAAINDPSIANWIQSSFSDVTETGIHRRPSIYYGVDPQTTFGEAGEDGETGDDLGAGDDGMTSNTVLSKDGGTDSVETATSLTYVYGLGQNNGKLAFNIIRIGDVTDDFTVQWRVVGHGGNQVDNSDFGGPTTGVVTLEGAAFVDGSYENAKNVVKVEIDLIDDALTEGDEGYRIELFNPGSGSLLGTSFFDGTINDENIIIDPEDTGPTPGPDVLNGDNTRNVINALGGNDTVRGKGGNDLLKGGGGNDTLFGDGGKDTLFGNGGHDELFGGGGRDRLKGGSGNDVLIGNKGNDVLTGNGGRDTFMFSKFDGNNTVTDFQNNRDKLDLSGFNFKNKRQALKKFDDAGSPNNDKVHFKFKGTEITVEGIDLDQLNGADLLI